MDQVTQQNAAMVEQSTAASHALAQEADQLNALIDQFKVREVGSEPRPARSTGTRDASPAEKPRRQAGRAVLRAVPSGGAATARKLQEAVQESWEEF
jgi:methyl-accepting chemotaxis protein